MTAQSVRLLDYHAAREAEEIQLEAAAGTRAPGADRDASRFYAQRGDGSGPAGRQPLTLRRWLEQTAVPAGDPEEVRRVHVTLVQDAHAELQAALEQVAACVAVLDARMADAQQDAGLSVRELGRMVGTSGQMVQRRIARWRAGDRA